MSGSHNGKKILIVEDEGDVVAYLEMLLQDAGYQTLIAKDGDEAMALVRSEKPDLVTLDISMPKATGTRFYRDIRTDAELSAVPVVIVTGVTGYGGDPRGYEKFISGRDKVPAPDGFFPKPVDKEKFLETVRELLGRD